MSDILMKFDGNEFGKALNRASRVYSAAQMKYTKSGAVALIKVGDSWNLVTWSKFVIDFQPIKSMQVDGLPDKKIIVFASVAMDGLHYTGKPASIAKLARKASDWRYREDGDRPYGLQNFEPRIYLDSVDNGAYPSVLGFGRRASIRKGCATEVKGTDFRKMAMQAYKNRKDADGIYIGSKANKATVYLPTDKTKLSIEATPSENFGMVVSAKFLKAFAPSGKTIMFAVARSDGDGEMRFNDQLFVMVSTSGEYCMFPGMVCDEPSQFAPCKGEMFCDGHVPDLVKDFLANHPSAAKHAAKPAKENEQEENEMDKKIDAIEGDKPAEDNSEKQEESTMKQEQKPVEKKADKPMMLGGKRVKFAIPVPTDHGIEWMDEDQIDENFHDDIVQDKPAKPVARKVEKPAKKPVVKTVEKPEKKAVKAEKSGWSVVIVPPLLTVKQIPALAGLRVRPIRDEKHHKVGYVGRGKNGKTVLVWRDWYVQRTTDEARKALLKRAKVAA